MKDLSKMYNICSWNTYVEYLCETLIEAHLFESR